MGLDANGTRFLLYARLLGIDFSRTSMIGRQHLNLEPSQLRANFRLLDLPVDEDTITRIFNANDGYAEELLRHLGAVEVESIDNSSYEGATTLHDLNEEIPSGLKSRYSLVLDSGSLEHVFNFPVALRSCMEMVAVGGHYIAITPANNFMGHGFYQFGHELFFSVFTEANGFELRQLIAFEDHPRAPWYRIRRAARPTTRIKSIHSRPVYLIALARRTTAVRPFEVMPQQTDYLAVWHASEGDSALPTGAPRPAGGPLWRAAVRVTPEPIKQFVKSKLRRRFDSRYYVKMRWADELRRLG